MLNIIWMLFVAWFLKIFGFDQIVVAGISQLGGPILTVQGYYFLFAVIGVIKHLIGVFNNIINTRQLVNLLDDDKNDLK